MLYFRDSGGWLKRIYEDCLGSSEYNNKEMSVTAIVSDVERQSKYCVWARLCLSVYVSVSIPGSLSVLWHSESERVSTHFTVNNNMALSRTVKTS